MYVVVRTAIILWSTYIVVCTMYYSRHSSYEIMSRDNLHWIRPTPGFWILISRRLCNSMMHHNHSLSGLQHDITIGCILSACDSSVLTFSFSKRPVVTSTVHMQHYVSQHLGCIRIACSMASASNDLFEALTYEHWYSIKQMTDKMGYDRMSWSRWRVVWIQYMLLIQMRLLLHAYQIRRCLMLQYPPCLWHVCNISCEISRTRRQIKTECYMISP